MKQDIFADLPAKFVQIISEAHGAKGTQWLADLSRIVEEIEGSWSIKVGKPFQNLSYHFVASCVCADGSEAVLKIGIPEDDSPIFNETEMLKMLDGRGAVKFLRSDETRFALLLEKLNPGEHLKTVFPNDDAKAVQIAIEVLRKIQRKPPSNHSFVLLEKWFKSFEKAENTAFPAQAVKKARNFYNEFTNEPKFLLHGDFHHENILSAEREPFLMIDPKGIVGEIGYEISVFLNNHVWWLESAPDLQAKINYAVVQFAEAFEIEPQALRKWAFAQAVLSAWWTFEENGENWQRDLNLAGVWEV